MLRAFGITLLLGSAIALLVGWQTTSLPELPRLGIESSSELDSEGAPADAPRVLPGQVVRPEPPTGFNTFDAGWIRFSYPPEVRERVQLLIDEAPKVRAELESRFGGPVLDSVVVHVARTPGEMATLAPSGAPFPSYASGVAYSQLGLVLLTLHPASPNAAHDLVEVFRHELAHVALHDRLGGHRVPRWFNEGLAIHLSRESSLARVRTLWTHTLSGDLITLGELSRGFPANSERAALAYAQSADVVRYLLRSSDLQRFGSLLNRLAEGQGFEIALNHSYGLDLNRLEYEWREEVNQRYSFWPILLSGSLIWVGVIGLFAVSWHRRRARQRATLDRWSREEAEEDRQRAALAMAPPRVHIVLGPKVETPTPAMPPRIPGEVPKVEHDGSWHTLH